MSKDFIYYLDLREVEIIHRWHRTCRREKICAKCRFKDKCEDTIEDFQEIRKEDKMSIKRELEMATEYLRKRLAETKDALNVNLGTPYQAKGNEYLKNKASDTEKAIELIEKISVG